MRLLKTAHNKHKLFFSLLLLLMILLGLKYSLKVDLPRVLFLLIIALIVFRGNTNEIIAMWMSCIPMHEMVDFYIAQILCLIAFVLKNYKKIRLNISIVPLIIIMIWELLHCFITSFSPITYIAYMLPFMAIVLLMGTKVSEIDYSLIIKAVTITTIGTCIVLIAKLIYLADFNIIQAISELQRLGLDRDSQSNTLTVSEGNIHPNSLGVICVLVICELLKTRTPNNSIGSLFSICILLIFGTLTASRTYIVCLALMIFLFLLGQQGNISTKLKSFSTLLVFFLLAIIILQIFFPDMLRYFIGRFQEKDITTGRFDTMAHYSKFIETNPRVFIFGIGLQDYAHILLSQHNVARVVPHNCLQEIIIAWGYPGLVLFVVFLLFMIIYSKRVCPRQTLLHFIPLIIILVKSLAGQLLTSPYSMLSIALSYLSLCADLDPQTDTPLE